VRPVVILYVAHPIGGDVDANVQRLLRWMSWLRRSYPETMFTAPYAVDLLSGADDYDPVQRAAGIAKNCALVSRLHGIVLVGGRVSSGMAEERDHAHAVADLTYLGEEPPDRLAWAPFILSRGVYPAGR
jgi:hypothetical protein